MVSACTLIRAFHVFVMAERQTHMFLRQLNCMGGGSSAGLHTMALVGFPFLGLSGMSMNRKT